MVEQWIKENLLALLIIIFSAGMAYYSLNSANNKISDIDFSLRDHINKQLDRDMGIVRMEVKMIYLVDGIDDIKKEINELKKTIQNDKWTMISGN